MFLHQRLPLPYRNFGYTNIQRINSRVDSISVLQVYSRVRGSLHEPRNQHQRRTRLYRVDAGILRRARIRAVLENPTEQPRQQQSKDHQSDGECAGEPYRGRATDAEYWQAVDHVPTSNTTPRPRAAMINPANQAGDEPREGDEGDEYDQQQHMGRIRGPGAARSRRGSMRPGPRRTRVRRPAATTAEPCGGACGVSGVVRIVAAERRPNSASAREMQLVSLTGAAAGHRSSSARGRRARIRRVMADQGIVEACPLGTLRVGAACAMPAETCGDNLLCSLDTSGRCSVEATHQCVGDDVFWSDGCGGMGELKKQCFEGTTCMNPRRRWPRATTAYACAATG